MTRRLSLGPLLCGVLLLGGCHRATNEAAAPSPPTTSATAKTSTPADKPATSRSSAVKSSPIESTPEVGDEAWRKVEKALEYYGALRSESATTNQQTSKRKGN